MIPARIVLDSKLPFLLTDMSARFTTSPTQDVVRTVDRVLDVAAALLLAGGAGLFFFGRWQLSSLAAGTYQVPSGVSYVSRADLHAGQTNVGIWLVTAGLVVAVVAAVRHVRARRESGALERAGSGSEAARA